MYLKLPALGAVLLMAGITGAAAQQSQVNPQPLARQSTGNPTQTPTLYPGAEQSQNPLVNPSAAGTQMSWKGYGATSGAVGAHQIGSDNSGTQPGVGAGSVTPGAGQPYISGSTSPTAANVRTPAEARQRLHELGYTNIVNVRKAGQSDWEAMAHLNKREVRVTIDEQGNVVGQR